MKRCSKNDTEILVLIIAFMIMGILNFAWVYKHDNLKQQYQQLEEENSTLMAALDGCMGLGPNK